MRIQRVPFCATDWNTVPVTEYPGEAGKASCRFFEEGNIRVRMIEYSPGYRADHWCSRGHVALVLEGALIVELKDGRRIALSPGMSFQAGDDAVNPHRVLSEEGAKIFIVD